MNTALLSTLLERTQKWGMREWMPVSFFIQIILIGLVQLIFYLWPLSQIEPPTINLSTDMSFVEFDSQVSDQAQSKDLADEVIAVDKLKDDTPINWNNAIDPAFDFDQRYTAILSINNANEEYPGSATTAKIGTVQVGVRIYIDASGNIRDAQILSIRSRGGAHKAFEEDFKKAARRVILYKTKLKNNPYKVNGVSKDFVWETTISFSLK